MADKLTEILSFRVPASLKRMSEGLSPDQKRKLQDQLRDTLARFIHNSRYDKNLYGLGEDEE